MAISRMRNRAQDSNPAEPAQTEQKAALAPCTQHHWQSIFKKSPCQALTLQQRGLTTKPHADRLRGGLEPPTRGARASPRRRPKGPPEPYKRRAFSIARPARRIASLSFSLRTPRLPALACRARDSNPAGQPGRPPLRHTLSTLRQSHATQHHNRELILSRPRRRAGRTKNNNPTNLLALCKLYSNTLLSATFSHDFL